MCSSKRSRNAVWRANITVFHVKKIAELRRKAEKKEKHRVYYEKNREKLIEKTKEKRRESRESDSCPQTHGSFTIKKAQKGSKAKEIREKRWAAKEERRNK